MCWAISHPSTLENSSTSWPTGLDRDVRGPDAGSRSFTALNAVTKHLKLLERGRLIERRKQGREVFISLSGKPLKVPGWVHRNERMFIRSMTASARSSSVSATGKQRDQKTKAPKPVPTAAPLGTQPFVAPP